MAFEQNQDVNGVAARLGISTEAVQLTRDAEVIDLHLDTFIPVRLVGYDPFTRHAQTWLRGHAFGHLDLPRAADAGLTGGMWSITTNPFRTAAGRWKTFEKNLARMHALIASSDGMMKLARTRSEYAAARSANAHACMLAVQGGNCFDAAPDGVLSVPDREITRVTVVHLTNSVLGTTSSPMSSLRRSKGLTERGRRFVEQLDEARVFVDLAHVHPDGFWDAVDAHDRTRPLIDTHTGVVGAKPHWRNLDDRQLKAIADTGGTVGIIFSAFFLEGDHGHRDGQMIVEHMQHVIDVVGEDFVSIGSDYDGAIIPPKELRSGDSYPRLVQAMLDRKWSEPRIRKVLGENFLRAFALLRP
ncbi:MAG: membrane dipeptidase [Deltaproteobacteria bacterium]|jgi:membrane dipeptidase